MKCDTAKNERTSLMPQRRTSFGVQYGRKIIQFKTRPDANRVRGAARKALSMGGFRASMFRALAKLALSLKGEAARVIVVVFHALRLDQIKLRAARHAERMRCERRRVVLQDDCGWDALADMAADMTGGG